MITYPITRVTVKDTPPPQQSTLVGRLYDISPRAEKASGAIERVVEEGDVIDNDFIDDSETKVVKRRGRRPAPAATEVAETK